jgi:putative membrane protein
VVSENAERRSDRLDTDIRFLLANERTLLAWLRTALSLEAAGFVLIRFGQVTGAAAVGLALLGLGAIGGLAGYQRYRIADHAIRAGTLPAPGRGPALLTLGVVGLSVVLIVLYAAGFS